MSDNIIINIEIQSLGDVNKNKRSYNIEDLNIQLSLNGERIFDNVALSTNETPQDETKRLEDYSWKEIDDIIKRCDHTKLFKIGDTKSFKLNDETLIAEIADFDHDDKTDGSGKAGISFILKNCMNTTHNMNSTSTNVNGWPGSEMYSYLNTNIYNKLPSDLQSVIKPVNKVTSKGNESTTLETSSDKLWLMSIVEVFGGSNTSYTPNGEGIQYPIFTDNTSRIKQVNGSNDCYWLRSPYFGYTTDFCGVCGVIGIGSIISTASNSFGVAFGFCI